MKKDRECEECGQLEDRQKDSILLKGTSKGDKDVWYCSAYCFGKRGRQ